MLDSMRANAQSWGVKVAFGIIIIVFVFWGIGSFTSSRSGVATVNGETISDMDFQRAYAEMEQNLRGLMPDVTQESLRSLGLEQQVLGSLVMQSLLEAEARRVGIEISPWELRRAVEELPFFKGEDGRFDRDLYLRVLEGAGRPVADFEKELKSDMLPQKLQTLLSAGAGVSAESVRRLFDFQQEKRTIDYLFFPAEAHMATATPTDAEVEQAYKERESQYAVPARVRVEYISISPDALADPAAVTDEAVAAAYDARRDQLTRPERVHARHILVKVAADASEDEVKKAEDEARAIESRIRGGEDFAAVAGEKGQDASAAQGGDLGWFTRQEMVPDFANAAFALKVGEMSGPVRSPFGFHIIKVEEREESSLPSLDEAAENLRADLAVEAAEKGLAATSDTVLAAALGGKSMAEAAAMAKGLKVEDSGLLAVDQLAEQLGLGTADAQAVAAAAAGTVLDSALSGTSGTLVVRVVESLPASTKPLEEVKEEIVASLTRAKAVELAREEAAAIRAAFVNNAPDAERAAEMKRSQPFGRDGVVPELGQNLELATAVFAEPVLKDDAVWLDTVFTLEDGAVLVRPVQAIAPDQAEWDAVAPILLETMNRSRASMLFEAYVADLHDKADVRILNPRLFQTGAEAQ